MRCAVEIDDVRAVAWRRSRADRFDASLATPASDLPSSRASLARPPRKAGPRRGSPRARSAAPCSARRAGGARRARARAPPARDEPGEAGRLGGVGAAGALPALAQLRERRRLAAPRCGSVRDRARGSVAGGRRPDRADRRQQQVAQPRVARAVDLPGGSQATRSGASSGSSPFASAPRVIERAAPPLAPRDGGIGRRRPCPPRVGAARSSSPVGAARGRSRHRAGTRRAARARRARGFAFERSIGHGRYSIPNWSISRSAS